MNGIRVCATNHFLVTPGMLDLSPAALPRAVIENRTRSEKDGEVDRVADEHTLVDTATRWVNRTGTPQYVTAQTHIGPRSIVTSNPNAVAVADWSGYEIAPLPVVDTRTEYHGTTLARVRIGRSTNQGFVRGTRYLDIPDRTIWSQLGVAQHDDTVLHRFWSSLTTPGLWRDPAQNLFEAHTYWVRVTLWAYPAMEGDD